MSEEPKKLSEERLKDYRAIFVDVMHGQLTSTPEVMADKGIDLLDHIAAMEAEQRAGTSRTASDAFEVGHANATFIERQTERMREMEELLNAAETALQPFANCESLSQYKCDQALRAMWDIKRFKEGNK